MLPNVTTLQDYNIQYYSYIYYIFTTTAATSTLTTTAPAYASTTTTITYYYYYYSVYDRDKIHTSMSSYKLLKTEKKTNAIQFVIKQNKPSWEITIYKNCKSVFYKYYYYYNYRF